MKMLFTLVTFITFCNISNALTCDEKPIEAAIELAKINGISLGGTHVKKVAASDFINVYTITGRDYDSGASHQFKIKRYASEDTCLITSVAQEN
jgi:hypothetical protein